MESTVLTSWIALSVGFLHALEPGHGKTALLTYLASGKKTWAEGMVISFTSAITHSASVFLIAFFSHLALHHGPMEDRIHELGGVLGYISGGLIISLGAWVIYKAKKGEDMHGNCCHHEEHDHEHNHHHDHDHSHSHEPKESDNKSNFLTSSIIGVATGIIPCPTVIVAYLSGVSTGNTFLGVKSVVFFAIGMILSLMLLITFFNFGGHKILDKFKNKVSFPINWGYLQGSVFVAIGLFTAFLH